MKVTPEEIKTIASLARISLTPSQVAKFQTEVTAVINYNVARLSGASVKLELPATTTLGQPDEPQPSLPTDLALANAPEQERGFVVVPKVLE